MDVVDPAREPLDELELAMRGSLVLRRGQRIHDVMPGPRVTVRGTVPSLEPEDEPGIQETMDCRVKPGNDR